MSKRQNLTKLFNVLLLIFSFMLTACSPMSNPFEQKSIDPSQNYYGIFAELPIPVVMILNSKRSLVTTDLNGNQVGLETYEANVDMNSLANTMSRNLAQTNWVLRGAASSNKLMQLYEKNNLTLILYFYSDMLSTTMEVWVLNRASTGLSQVGQSNGNPNMNSPYQTSNNVQGQYSEPTNVYSEQLSR